MHSCPVPDANCEPCGEPHTAKQHLKAAHRLGALPFVAPASGSYAISLALALGPAAPLRHADDAITVLDSGSESTGVSASEPETVASLPDGVPLGVDSEICLFPPVASTAVTTPLEHHTSAWASARENSVSGRGASRVDSTCSGRNPPSSSLIMITVWWADLVSFCLLIGHLKWLAVDSSISGVTDNTFLPNRSANPTLSGLRRCSPSEFSRERLTGLVLDVSKAHRQIKVRPSGQDFFVFLPRRCPLPVSDSEFRGQGEWFLQCPPRGHSDSR